MSYCNIVSRVSEVSVTLDFAEWPAFGKELLTGLTIFCILTVCNFSYITVLVLRAGFGF